MRFRFHRRASGYVLMAILFFMALLIIGLLVTAPAIKTQIQRDREEEMIHRGAQYSRAIKKYFKKFGRYPGSIEQLKQTNNIRFLRKDYKDPMSADGKWRLLHIGDVKLGSTPNIGTPVSAMGTSGGTSGNIGQPAGQSAFGASGTLGGSPGILGGAAAAGAAGTAAGAQPSATGGVSSAQGSASSPSSMTASTSAIGGGVIIGVASLSEKQGLHEFNEKTHYNEWYFFYDPTVDRGGLITGPFTGKTFSAGGAVGGGLGVPAGAQVQQQPGSFGQPSSFGQSSSFGQPGGMGQPNPPQQQQPPGPR